VSAALSDTPESRFFSARYLRIAELSVRRKIAVLQHRPHAVRIDRNVFRLVVLAFHQVDDFQLAIDAFSATNSHTGRLVVETGW